MISRELEAGWDSPRDGSHAARVEWHQRQRRREQAAAGQRTPDVAEERRACAAAAAQASRSLGSSNCHISPRDLFYPSKLHAWLHSPQAEELNEKQHGEYMDAASARDQKRRVRFYYEGTLIRIDGLPGWEEYEKENRAKRGKVSGFSVKARCRMLQLVSSLKASALPVFLTLTYPAAWNVDPAGWKRDLDTFGKWLTRSYPETSAIWKLEPQRRGAPHFHLLVYGIPFLPWQTVAVRWAEIVSNNKLPRTFPVEKGRLGAALFHGWITNNIESAEIAAHVSAGVRVEPVRTRRGVMRYCSKNYMGKEFLLPDGWDNVGRFWGVIGRKKLPRSEVSEVEITVAGLARVRRTVRRWFASKGMRGHGFGGLTLYTSLHWQWLRAVELAETGATVARDWVKAPP